MPQAPLAPVKSAPPATDERQEKHQKVKDVGRAGGEMELDALSPAAVEVANQLKISMSWDREQATWSSTTCACRFTASSSSAQICVRHRERAFALGLSSPNKGGWRELPRDQDSGEGEGESEDENEETDTDDDEGPKMVRNTSRNNHTILIPPLLAFARATRMRPFEDLSEDVCDVCEDGGE
jgi:hypothetical protein